jgi:hypothetical protein
VFGKPGALVGDGGGPAGCVVVGELENFPGNIEVFLRASKDSDLSDPSNPAGRYELQINNEGEKWATESIENYIQRLVTVYPVPNQWYAYDVAARGDHIVATLDGTKVLDGRDAKFKAGYIGLQHHKDNKIEFRNIRVKALAKLNQDVATRDISRPNKVERKCLKDP